MVEEVLVRAQIMKYAVLLLVLLVGLPVWSGPSVFEMPTLFSQHQRLRQALAQSIRAGKTDEMAQVCQEAVTLFPDDPTWQYNLACALAYRADKAEALAALDHAIDLGFRNDKLIAADQDLKQLKELEAFKKLLAKAKRLQSQPLPTSLGETLSTTMMGVPVEVSSSNTIWNFDLGAFSSHFKLIPPQMQPVSAYGAAYHGAAAELLRPWFEADSVAGNIGDLYVNRDGGHSCLPTTNYPGMTPVVYSVEAQKYSAHMGLPNGFFNGPVLGNASLSIVTGPYWRSLPRACLTEPLRAVTAFRFYFDNQIWVFPEHHDYDLQRGDLFPANAPFFVITQGSSGSDQPFVSAFAATLAAFTPATKRALVYRKALAPTLRAILCATQKSLKQPEDYLTGLAHPVVFDAKMLNVAAMVQMAHGLTPEQIPPLVLLRTIKDAETRPGIDYFDLRSEILCETPCCLARVVRGVARERMMTVAAISTIKKPDLTYTWRVLQGDPDKVTIKPLQQDGSQVEIRVAYHGSFTVQNPDGLVDPIKRHRVDIGCFVKGTPLDSAPAMISLYYLPNETRVYRDDGQILSVDYANAAHAYADPILTLDKGWKDLYAYDAKGGLTGWYRTREGGQPERFTWQGHKVLKTDAQNRPILGCEVEYLPRQVGGGQNPATLTCVDTQKRFKYTYADDADLIGTPSADQ